ncbi:polyhydroxyalkanoate depolymerase [Sphingosinicella sp.]|uniref:polyhydroxyalkanoate depolymerase n=1 Tax=Sphingosinicella sp. TaxID=1917971 RepID=UPI00260844AD|nr:polyhydroxyalkanoate depolymerase [Sphingosinicella sp.]
MIYHSYELHRSMMAGASAFASMGANWLAHPSNPLAYIGMSPVIASALDVFAHASAPRGKPEFGIHSVKIGDADVAVREEISFRLPFGQLKHFVKQNGVAAGPKLLIVAPMSGHYATLLRGTVQRMIPGHDVYITDWRDAKLVPLDEGRFDLDDYVDYIVAFLNHIGPGTHMIAVCQPSVPAYAAAALMSAKKHKARPRSLTMMGGPIDTREVPTEVNTLATGRGHSWFEHNAITTVPPIYAGAGRRVYPGFLQLAGFMSMNLGNHMMSHWEMFRHLVEGDGESADSTKAFYDEYRAVCDMTAEFYLQTVDAVFQRHLLPKGEFLHRGTKIDPAAITDVALLAVEGERDDISGVGQTKAALTLATALPAAKKEYLLAKEVGHYGIFNGRRWREKIAPVVEDFIAKHD